MGKGTERRRKKKLYKKKSFNKQREETYKRKYYNKPNPKSEDFSKKLLVVLWGKTTVSVGMRRSKSLPKGMQK